MFTVGGTDALSKVDEIMKLLEIISKSSPTSHKIKSQMWLFLNLIFSFPEGDCISLWF